MQHEKTGKLLLFNSEIKLMRKNEKEIKKVKEIFTSLDKDYKQIAREELSKQFNVSENVINNHWMYKGEIPPAYLLDVLKIIRMVAEKQIKSLKKIIA